MNEQSIRLTPLAAAITAVLYPIQPALAQDENPELEEVIVTATFRETSLQVVPQSITAFTAADIEKNNLQTLDDIVAALPSLNIFASQPGRTNLVYRGISSGTGEYYTDSQTAVYLDDSSITLIAQQPFPHVVDIERLESLPGPQGTLFGSSSQTGTTRIITKQPNMDGVSGGVFGELGTTKGGDASYEINGWVNIPIVEGLALRAVGYHVKDGGWIDNVPQTTYVGPTESGPQFDISNAAFVQKNQNKDRLSGGRITALWELSEDLSVTFAVISEDNKSEGTWDSDPALGDFKIARFTNEDRDDKWTNYAFTIDADVGFAAFKSVTSVFDRNIKYTFDNMAYEQYKDSYFGYYNGYVLYNTQYTWGQIFNDQNQKRFSQEFRLTSQSDSKLQWVAGAYYEDLHDDWYYGADNPQLMETVMWPYAQYWAYYYNYYGYPVDYPIAPTIVGYSNRLDRDIEQYALFGEVTYDITDKWRLMGGLRWFHYDRYDFQQNQFPEGLPPWGTMETDGAFVGEGKTSDTMFKGSIQYQIDDEKMVYFLYSQGFRLGGFNPLRAVLTGLVPAEYDPDKLDNFELGLKSQWMDNRLLINATLFHMKWSDYQQTDTGIDNQWWLRGTFNAADAKTTGLEVQTTYLFTENFQADFSMFWADPEWDDDFIFPSQDPDDPDYEGPGIRKGDVMPNSPKYKGRLGLFWDIPGLFGNADAFVNYDISFQGKTWNSSSNVSSDNEDGIIPSWNVSNLQLGTRLQNDWTLTLVVRNLFDQKAVSWLNTGGNYISDWFGADWNRNIRSYNRPRTISLQVRKNWY